MNTRTSSILLFLLGLGSETQVRLIGSAGISEFVVFTLAPIVFIQDYNILRRDGFLPAIWLAIAAMTGCVCSSWANHTPFAFMARGFATTYSLFAIPVVLHRLLRNNLQGVRWLFWGIAISSVITIFAFHNATEVYQYSAGEVTKHTTSDIAGGQLFAMAHFGMLVVLPVYGWYFATPTPYLVVAPLILTVYTIFTSASGRSAILTALLSSLLILIARKSVRNMRRLQKHILSILIVGLVVVSAVASLYKYAGRHGYLNEQAQKKYEAQVQKGDSKKKTGLLQLLMGGRIEFFVGTYACLQSPIWGKGPWAYDYDGIYGDFLAKYGNAEDYEAYCKAVNYYASIGMERIRLIPAHSHLIGFWLGYGILGLPYWIYILFLIYSFFRKYLAAIPHFFGYFACAIPGTLWGIFFSPYGARLGGGLFVTMLLLARAVGEGHVRLPMNMCVEIQKKDREK